MSAALKQDERLARLEGIGCARKRREDPRFIQGRGTYVEDVKMPGMCFGVMVRSPYAHARVRRIDTAGTPALPGVVAVITAQQLKPFKLHWMPLLDRGRLRARRRARGGATVAGARNATTPASGQHA